ncbi:hypothetical protein As57867_003085, partial [Aphanomyces stellatus]
MFGVPPATFSRTLAKAEAALRLALDDIKDAHVLFPSKRLQRQWACMANAREPVIHGVWGFLDGKNYRVRAPTPSDLQNAYYNGWLHCTFVTGTLLFGIDGTIVWARHNFVGSWNDGDTSLHLQEALMDPRRVAPGHGVVSDSAFPVKNGLAGKIRTPLKEGTSTVHPPLSSRTSSGKQRPDIFASSRRMGNGSNRESLPSTAPPATLRSCEE